MKVLDQLIMMYDDGFGGFIKLIRYCWQHGDLGLILDGGESLGQVGDGGLLRLIGGGGGAGLGLFLDGVGGLGLFDEVVEVWDQLFLVA